MKTGKIILFFGLVIVLAAGINATPTACTKTDDCEADSGGYSSVFCANNLELYNASGTFYDCIAGTCQIASPQAPPYGDYISNNCSSVNDEACQNYNLYSLTWTCPTNGCELTVGPIIGAGSPKCDPTTACAGDAHRLATAPTDLTYNDHFHGTYVLDNGTFAVAPGTYIEVNGIGNMKYWCGNGVNLTRTSNLFLWVYNATNNQRLARGRNNIEIAGGLDREDLIGPSALTRGVPVTNAIQMLIQYYMENTVINNIYTFNKSTRYSVYIDVVSGYCAPNYNISWPTTQNYVCPSGITRPGVNLCFWEGAEVDGWTHLKNYSVIVPGPDTSFVAPSNQTNLTGTTIQKSWTINNNGIGKITMNVTYDCGGWACSFQGYTAGSAIPLVENESRTLTLNITLGAAEVNHLVSINTTYDEGYGLAAIAPLRETSNISITSINAPATLVGVTLNQPASGSNVSRNITLNYTITGSNNTYNVSLNLNGNVNNQTGVGKLNNTLYNFTLTNLNPGVYRWNVTAYINSSVYNTSETRNFTVPAAPWLNITLSQPLIGVNVSDNLTLNYTIAGSNNTYNVSLNLNGSINNLTGVGKLNNTLYGFNLGNLSPGSYSWNVTAYISSLVYNTSQTWGFTVTTTTTTTTIMYFT
jgi:hypothetical protein